MKSVTFIPTGEFRQPKIGEYYLRWNDMLLCDDPDITPHEIFTRTLVESDVQTEKRCEKSIKNKIDKVSDHPFD